VRVCVGVARWIAGSLDLLAALEGWLGVEAGGTTADGSLTLERLDCAFNYSVAPVVEVDHACRGRVGEAHMECHPPPSPSGGGRGPGPG